MKNVTIKEATQQWINGFNAVDSSLIQRAFENEIDNWCELTTLCTGDYVVYQGDEYDLGYESFEVVEVDTDDDTVTLELNGTFEEEYGATVTVDMSDVYTDKDNGWLPMWGTLWSFGERMDEEWARENLSLISDCGFRVFEDIITGDIYLGIDGAGYDFYEFHWMPLYKARGLQWHTEK